MGINVKTHYNARGDAGTDDTRALQRALDTNRTGGVDYNGRPRTLYLPTGTYLISETLDWIGCAMTLQGQGAGATIIRLADAAPGFGDPANPKPMIQSPAGNMSFRQNIHDLTIHTGAGNPGAVGLDYISSNSGTVRDVEIVSDDGGVVGLDMTRAWPGPLFIKNVKIVGFDYGIKVKHSEYGPTFEDIILENQRVAGFHNNGNVCAIRRLTSTNSVPAIVNEAHHGYILLLDGTFHGGRADVCAIESDGLVYARTVTSEGSSYDGVLCIGGTPTGGHTIDEYVSGEVRKLWDTSPDRSLNLPVNGAPSYHDNDTSQWGAFKPRWYGDTKQLQELLNSGKSTIYFQGVKFNHTVDTFTVPAQVRRIVGFHGVVNKEVGPAAIVFRVAENSRDPLIIEQFGYGIAVEHACARTVALKHGQFGYWANESSGDVFFEDVQSDKLEFFPQQNVWMRQLNTEGPELHVVNNGAKLWILGVKTEGKGTVIHTKNGGYTELLGTLLYPCNSFAKSDGPAFISENAHVSFMYRVSAYVDNGNYWTQVIETRGGETRQWEIDNNTHMICPLFSGFDSTAAAVDGVVVTPGQRVRKDVSRTTLTLTIFHHFRKGLPAALYDIRGRHIRGGTFEDLGSAVVLRKTGLRKTGSDHRNRAK